MTLPRVNASRARIATSEPAKVVAKPSRDDGAKPSRTEALTLTLHVGSADDELRFTLRRPSIVLPLQVGVIALRDDAGRDVVVDRARFVVWPVGSHTARVVSPAVRLLVLGIDEALVARVVALYGEVGVDGPRFARWLATGHVLARTTWVHEIAHRYLFERQVCRRDESEAARFLESELVKELYFLLRDREEHTERTSLIRRYGPTVERAVAHVEAHLFDRDLGVGGIARAAGASESTLLRAFKRELGCAPTTYVRARRLDEALALLESGALSVGEVAARVGYESLTAFSQAFRQRFGKAPSVARRR